MERRVIPANDLLLNRETPLVVTHVRNGVECDPEVCPKSKEGHCDHWWDGLEPCCKCGDNTDPMPSEEGW